MGRGESDICSRPRAVQNVTTKEYSLLSTLCFEMLVFFQIGRSKAGTGAQVSTEVQLQARECAAERQTNSEPVLPLWRERGDVFWICFRLYVFYCFLTVRTRLAVASQTTNSMNKKK